MSTLLVIKGPQIGVRFSLSERSVIGRGDDCEARLNDREVSRRHAEIVRDNDAYTIRDLESVNGVVVNGARVSERRLKRNDLILLGTTHLLFDAEPDLENTLYGDKTVAVGRSAGETLRQPRVLPEAIGTEEVGQIGIELIVQIGDLLSARAESLPDLLHSTISQLVRMFGADRGAVFLWDALNERLEPVVAVCDEETMQVDHTLLMRVFAEGQTLLAEDVQPDLAALRSDDEKEPSPIASVICAPLREGGESAGVLLIDCARHGRFSLRDARILRAIGQMLSEPIEAARLRARLGLLAEQSDDAPMMIGRSAALAATLERANQAAGHDVTVLIVGATGVGKELVAREIHAKSRRAAGPFVALNCAAIPSDLFEAQLFGHERGAFTGAVAMRRGRVELAHGGTLFLDEIAELTMAHQAKMLRFLQDHTLYRVGGQKPIRANVRVIAATRADLETRVREGAFREDLFFRLNVLTLTVPPLRERREDIRLLADHLARRCGQRSGKPIVGVTDEAIAKLEGYDWPGNVRELENMIERAVILTRSNRLNADAFHLGPYAPHDVERETTVETRARDEGTIRALEEIEREHILGAVERFGGNQVEAARALGIHRNTLRNKLTRYVER
jgi:two-component system response regulator HydG